jgi:alpha-tubulin suppressor-like RCC1 family protein
MRGNVSHFRKTAGAAVLGIASLFSARGWADPLLATASIGSDSACALTSNGLLSCWGGNCDGELGVPTPCDTCTDCQWGPTTQPVIVSTLGQVQSVALGFGGASPYGCAIKASDGSVWCWGSLLAGNNGTYSPRQVSGIAGVRQISAGFLHACAVLPDSTLWCWGTNGDGELGDGSTVSRSTAAPATLLGSTVASVACGNGFTCAVRTDGTLWCWGYNFYGELGDGTTQSRPNPMQVTLGSSAAAVDAGSDHVCARLTDGTIRCWGHNYGGALGNGYTTDSAVPVAPLTPAGAFLQVSAGNGYTCAVRTDGSLWCWGYNGLGQLGDGTTSNSTVPEQVLPLGNHVLEVSTGGDSTTCARLSDHSLTCWGGPVLSPPPFPPPPPPPVPALPRVAWISLAMALCLLGLLLRIRSKVTPVA